MKTSMNNRLSNTILGGWIALVLLVFSVSQPAEAKPNAMGVSFQVFYDGLAPYGDWVQDPTHGYIWIPYVDAGFQPYRTNGYWVNSRFGNTWVSLYDWGWAPFHYGRWFYTDFYGWAWVPGYEWAPAWVEWRTGGGYYGWAPMWPRVGVHVSVGFPVNHWVFVPRRRFLARNVYNYYIPARNVTVIYNQTTVINNTYVYNNRTYVAGPSRTELQRVTRSRVPVYDVRDGQRPGRANLDNNQLTVYRPNISQTSARSNAAEVRPSRAYTANEYQERRRTNTAAPTTVDNSRSAARQEQRSSATVPSNTSPRVAAGANVSREAASSARASSAEPANVSRSTEPSNRTQPASRSGANQVNSGNQLNNGRSQAPSQASTAPVGARVEQAPRSSDMQQRQQVTRPSSAPATRQAVQPRQNEEARQQQVRPSAPASTGRVTTAPRTNQNRVSAPQARTQQQSRAATPSSRSSQSPRVSTNSGSSRQSSAPRVSSGSSSRSSSAASNSRSARSSTSQGRRGN